MSKNRKTAQRRRNGQWNDLIAFIRTPTGFRERDRERAEAKTHIIHTLNTIIFFPYIYSLEIRNFFMYILLLLLLLLLFLVLRLDEAW